MSHFLAARPTAAAHRRRVLAPLVGVLALVVAMFAMTAPAGAQAHHGTKPPAGKPAPPGHAPQDADKPANKPAQDDDNAAGKPKDEDKNAGKPKDEDRNQGKPEDDQDDDKAECDSSGPGNPCHPPQQCGQNSGPGNANDQCPAGNPECPGANDGPRNAQGEAIKGDEKHGDADHHKAKHEKNNKAKHEKNHKAKHDKNNKAKHQNVKKDDDEDDDDAANCPPPNNECKDGQVKHGNMCVPVDECKPPNVVDHGECKPPVNNEGCPPGQVRQQGACVNEQPNNPVVCQAPQVLQGNVCVTPNTTPAAQQANQAPATAAAPGTAPTPAPTPATPDAVVAGTRTRSATARLQTQSRCGTRSFRVTISGRNLRRVTLFVAGRRVRTVTVPAGRRSITVSVPVQRFGARRQSVRARVTFRNGAAARTLTASATRCAQTAVSPQFTG